VTSYADHVLVKANVAEGKGVLTITFPEEAGVVELLIGDRLILSFSKSLDFKPSRILEELKDFLDDLTLQKEGKVLVFDLKENPKIHPEVEQEKNIVKIILSAEKAKKKSKKVLKKEKPKPPVRNAFDVLLSKHDGFDRITLKWDSSLVKYTTDFKNQVFKVTFNQAAKLDPYKVEKLKSDLVSEVKILDLTPFTIAFSLSEKLEVVPRKDKNKLYLDVLSNKEALKDDTRQILLKKQVDNKEPQLQPQAQNEKKYFEILNEEELLVTPLQNAGLIVFQRGDIFYLGFDRKLNDEVALFEGRKALVNQFKRVSNPEITIFAAPIKDNFDVKILRKGKQWKLVFFTKDQKTDLGGETIEVKRDPLFPKGERVLIENTEASKMFWFTDPYVKDRLKLIPLSNPGERIDFNQSFIQFNLLKTFQGIVIKELDERLSTRFMTDGVEISHPKKLYLSTRLDLDPTVEKSHGPDLEVERELLFDFVEWRQGGFDQFQKVRENFLQMLIYTDPAEKNAIRFDFAKFHLSHGLAHETLGILNFLKDELPGIEDRPDYKLVCGLAAYLARQKQLAIKQFSDPVFDQNDEVKLWRALLDEDIEKNKEALYKYAYFVEAYPYPLQHHVALDLISKLIRLQEFERAKLVLRSLEGNKLSNKIAKPGIIYYNGVIAKSENDLEKATKDFTMLSKYKDRYYRALSKLCLIDIQLFEKQITVPEAIKVLENLKFTWRGDQFERDVLIELTNAYLREKKYRSALEYMKKIVTLFPEHSGTQLLTSKMNKLYQDVFLTDKLNELSAIEAYSLYKNFIELNPVDKSGNQVIENIAEKLVDIEALDKAEEMYDYQLEYRLEGLDKAETGARLAAIYLLDNKPDKALTALDKSISEKVSKDLSEKRQVLRASALVSMYDLIAAKDLLKHMNTEPSNMLLIDIAWKEEKWSHASKLLEKMIANQTANHKKSLVDDYVIKLATALSLADDQLALQRLKDVFQTYMKDSPNQQIFEMLTLPEKNQEVLDMTYIQDQIKDVEIFDQFLENYKK